MSVTEIRRQLAYAAGVLRRRPFQVLLQVTNRCNMSCPFCGFWPHGAHPDAELSLPEIRGLATQLADLGCFLVSIEGGEPFLRQDLVDIVRAFAARHIPLLYTNGWYVEPEVARALFLAGLAQVGVSIDFPDAARHDTMRSREGAFERAWRAVELFRDAAPHAGKQVHVMTVLMEENRADLESLLEMSAAHRVGHSLTLISGAGERRGGGGTAPKRPISAELLRLWRGFPHLRIFRDTLERVDPFLGSRRMPACLMGSMGFNVDHLGNVSRCIERIGEPAGNVREERLATIHARMSARSSTSDCQACFTACRGYSQALGGKGRLGSFWDLATRMRSA